ncbi:Moa, A lectin from the mushroom marasmius Oreades in complex with the trisaccharide Galgalglcnac [Cubamyces menziesii]|uniref:Agglutinin n=1 Tax=Trametes cubensis TaxID=1111947 RepID=A0AAD7TSA9_9APHY|nr:Moa, A lectin from the mushroom marasmius Oreades in complex with the trisaccharide Galgalglcnac [Cubamyces menziesii]KAJ8475440.1 hypothetical protein ONZ51_g6540 [Trametes cubensis]
MSFKGDGIYRIQNGYVPMRIALTDHSSADKTPVIGWDIKDDFLDHMWLITSVSGEANTYYIRNIYAGTYMDLANGSSANNTPVIAFHKASPGESQKWIIKLETSGSGHWKIQNKGAGTFVDLYRGGPKIVGWEGYWDERKLPSMGHQLWDFYPQSLLGHEIHTILEANPYLKLDFKSYISDGMYLILDRTRLQAIWRNSGLSDRKWREEIFDCDDFSFVYKSEVAKWGDSSFKADGFAIICGVMFGTNAVGQGHAYNWMISPEDHSAIVFFEPQNNTFMENPGYKAYFGVF